MVPVTAWDWTCIKMWSPPGYRGLKWAGCYQRQTFLSKYLISIYYLTSGLTFDVAPVPGKPDDQQKTEGSTVAMKM